MVHVHSSNTSYITSQKQCGTNIRSNVSFTCSTVMDVMANSVPMITLYPGDLENLVGKRGSDLVGSGDVCAIRQPPEDPGEIKAGIAMGNLEQHPVHDLVHEFLGFIGEGSRPVILIRLQGVNKTLEELGQSDTGGLFVIDGETPALHIHLGDLGANALGGVNKPGGPEGELLVQLGIFVFGICRRGLLLL